MTWVTYRVQSCLLQLPESKEGWEAAAEAEVEGEWDSVQAAVIASRKSAAANPPVSRSRLPFKSRIFERGPSGRAMAAPTPGRIREGMREV